MTHWWSTCSLEFTFRICSDYTQLVLDSNTWTICLSHNIYNGNIFNQSLLYSLVLQQGDLEVHFVSGIVSTFWNDRGLNRHSVLHLDWGWTMLQWWMSFVPSRGNQLLMVRHKNFTVCIARVTLLYNCLTQCKLSWRARSWRRVRRPQAVARFMEFSWRIQWLSPVFTGEWAN